MKPSDYEVDVREFDTRDRHVFFFFSLFFFLFFSSMGDGVLCMHVPFFLQHFERSEFLIATCSKEKADRLSGCPDVRLILVLVWKNCLGFSVGYQRAPGWF